MAGMTNDVFFKSLQRLGPECDVHARILATYICPEAVEGKEEYK